MASSRDQALSNRFRKWLNLCPPETRFLASAVEERLVPKIESWGFRRVDIALEDPEQPVSGSELRFERVSGDYIDCVEFNFWKYRSPKFQVHLSRRLAVRPNALVRSGNLVRRASQYYHLWGKPWWRPIRLWTEGTSIATIASIESRLAEVPAFLERGERGGSISRAVDSSPTKKSDA